MSSANRTAHVNSMHACFAACRTNEAALGNVKLIASGSDPDAAAVDTDETGLALGVLGEEGHAQTLGHPFHRSSGSRGHGLCGLDQSLE